MSKKDKDNEDQAWMHYSGAKQGWEKMMQGAPELSDYGRTRGVDPEDVVNSEGFAKASAMHNAKMASGAWMTETSDIGHMVDKKQEPNYKHPHLAALANDGWTFDQIQQAGNNLGIKSFNSENDGNAIREYLENHYNPKVAEEDEKEEEDTPLEATPEEREKWDAIEKRLKAKEDYQIAQQEKGSKGIDRYGDRKSYIRDHEDMRDKAKDPEAMNFLNMAKKDVINRERMRA